jgi:hypothetical protein
MIADLMFAKKQRGKVKDWAVISGSRLVDWRGSYDVQVKDGALTDSVTLIHKRDLFKVLEEGEADRFWNRRTNMRSFKQ